MADITLSGQEAEMGLVPSVCMVCGCRGALTRSIRLCSTEAQARPIGGFMGLVGLFVGQWSRRSVTVLMPLCDEHQPLRRSQGRPVVRATKITDRAIMLTNVAQHFVEELHRVTGGARRMGVQLPPKRATADDSVNLDQRWGDDELVEAGPILASAAESSSESRRRPTGGHSSPLVLLSVVALVAPLLICTGLLLASIMRFHWLPQRRLPVPAQPQVPGQFVPAHPFFDHELEQQLKERRRRNHQRNAERLHRQVIEMIPREADEQLEPLPEPELPPD